MEEAGVAIGLGVDGSASNDESNLMQEVRAAFLLQRARYGVGRVSHKDALRWATKGSAACVGRPELGEIAVGKAADLALFKLDELRFSGHGDPLAALVLCGAHRADRVMVGGKLGGDRWRHPRARCARSDPPPQRRRACDAGGVVCCDVPERAALSPLRESWKGVHEHRACGPAPSLTLPASGEGTLSVLAARYASGVRRLTCRESCRRCP